MNKRDSQPIETLRISERDKSKLLWAIEESSKRDPQKHKRRLRVNCTHNDAVLTLLSDTGGSSRFTVLARNVSRYGVSLVHGRYVHPGMRCEVQLLALDGSWCTCTGQIRHSRHVQGLVHELGIKFDQPIDLGNFSTLTPSEETSHLQELADDLPKEDSDLVTQLASRVLVVDDYASDRKLFSHWLNRAGMLVTAVSDGNSAKERNEQSQFELAVIDMRLGAESGLDLIRTLRRAQFVGPVLAVTADDGGVPEEEALSAGANRFLRKPFTGEDLVSAACELMGLNTQDQSQPIFSTLNDDPEMRPLLTEFTRGLPSCMEQLREANARHDYELLDQIARTLKGTGEGYGFQQITDKAGEVLTALNDNDADFENIKHTANQLLSILNRVRLRAAG